MTRTLTEDSTVQDAIMWGVSFEEGHKAGLKVGDVLLEEIELYIRFVTKALRCAAALTLKGHLNLTLKAFFEPGIF